MICYDNPSLQAGCCFHLYQFESHDPLFALLLMSDGEIFAQPSAYPPPGGSLSFSEQGSNSTLPYVTSELSHANLLLI